jgi:ribose transport system substrate-binding protein
MNAALRAGLSMNAALRAGLMQPCGSSGPEKSLLTAGRLSCIRLLQPVAWWCACRSRATARMPVKTLVISLLPVLALLGCSRKQENAAASEPPSKARQKLFVMVPKGVGAYYEPCYKGFQDAARKYGVKAEYRASKALEVPQQVEIMEHLIARGVDGIALSALDDQGLMAAIEEATRAGIKVITFDAPAPSSKALTYIGTMNEAAGYTAAEQLVKVMRGEGEVAVLQAGLGAPNLNERFYGFERFLKEKAPKVHIVAREDEQGKMDLTVNKTEALLQAHPSLKAIFGVSAEVCPGAAAALKQQGRAGKVILAGFDDLPDTVAAIRSGVVNFCIAQRTYKMGWLAIEKLLQAVDNKPLAKEFDTGVLIITRDNASSYMEEMKQEFMK